MSIESAVKEELQTITASVFPLNAPEGQAYPYLVYASSGPINTQTLSGVLSSKEIEFELYVVSSTYSNLKTLASGVIQRLLSFQGRAIGTTDVSNKVQEVVIADNPEETYDKTIGEYRMLIEFTLYV